MPSVMSVSVHCMRLAASYDTLMEDKLRYRRKYSVTLVLPISDFISTFFLGGILSFLVSISDTRVIHHLVQIIQMA